MKTKETKGGAVAIVPQPAKDEICVPEMKSDSGLGPASVINMEIDTDEETDRIRGKKKSEDTDKKETRSNLSKSIDDAPDDEIFKGGNAKSAKLESVRYTKVRRGERSKHDAFKGPVDETCEKTYLKKSTLDPHMHPVSDMEDDGNKNSDADQETKGGEDAVVIQPPKMEAAMVLI